MNKLLLAFLLTLATLFVEAQTNVSGNISSNTTWTLANSPYTLVGNVGIPSSYTLTIEPGVIVQRSADYQILINGTIVINGTQTDSIVFSSGNSISFSSTAFIEFQKSTLSNSSLKFVTFRNQSSSGNNMRLGTGVTTSPNNSGSLLIKRSNVGYGMITTKGNQTTASLTMDSCKVNTLRLWGYSSIFSEPISILNSTITNSRLISDANNYGITITNCTMQSTYCATGVGGKYIISNSKIEDSKIGTINDALLPGAGDITISSCILKNSPVGGNSSTKFSLQNSKVIATKQLYGEYGEITHLVYGVITMSNTELQNTSANNYGGIYISGGANSIANNLFNNLYDAVYVAAFSSITLGQNNFRNITRYHISNHSTQNFSALNNYYELKTSQTINDVIFDNNDDLNFGVVTYNPFSVTLLTTGPISKPNNALKRISGTNVLVNWNKNKESNLQKYKVYWGYVDGFTYLNSAVVPLTDSFYTITGASINDSIAVTAINTSSTGTNDQTLGYESWFSPAKFTSVVPVKLINFTASLKNNVVDVSWLTTQEINTALYEIEKSTNGIDFSKIGSVNSKGVRNSMNDYSFPDFSVNQSKNYYRLKIIDNDGKYTYSYIVTISKTKNTLLTVYPNPAKDLLFVNYEFQKGTTIQVVDLMGQVLLSKEIASNTLHSFIDISKLNAGNYFLKIISQDNKQTVSFNKF